MSFHLRRNILELWLQQSPMSNRSIIPRYRKAVVPSTHTAENHDFISSDQGSKSSTSKSLFRSARSDNMLSIWSRGSHPTAGCWLLPFPSANRWLHTLPHLGVYRQRAIPSGQRQKGGWRFLPGCCWFQSHHAQETRRGEPFDFEHRTSTSATIWNTGYKPFLAEAIQYSYSDNNRQNAL